MGRSAETIYSNLDEAARSTARQLFLRLVTLGEGTEDTRRRVLREELESLLTVKGQLSTVIEPFGKARLLSFDRDPITRGATVEVAHEALLREWIHLREWLIESRSDVRIQRQLNDAMHEWNAAERDISFLITGSRLDIFEHWNSNATIVLTEDESAFLTTSLGARDQREAEEQARRKRELRDAKRLRQRAVFLSVALILAIAFAGTATIGSW